MKTLAIIIPCYNEEDVLPVFINEVTCITEKIYKNFNIISHLIFVDDGSTDQTLKIIKDFKNSSQKKHYFFVEYISFTRNFGKEAAMYAGLCEIKADYFSIMDADMEDPPKLLLEMLDKITNSNCDCVAAKRKYSTNNETKRAVLRKLYYYLFKRITKLKLKDGTRNFRLMNERMVETYLKNNEKSCFSNGLFEWMGYKTEWIEYPYTPRHSGIPKWNFKSLFKYAVNSIVEFTNSPLQLPFYLSFMFFIFTTICAIILGVKNDFTSILLLILIGCGFIGIFLCFGIIGIYIGKIKDEIARKDRYVIKETNKDC